MSEKVRWNDQDAVELEIGSLVRINGQVWQLQGIVHNSHALEWDSMDLEFDQGEEQEFHAIPVDDAPDETITTTEMTEYKDGKRVRSISSTVVATAVRPVRGNKDYS